MSNGFVTGGEGYGYTEEEWLMKQNLRKLCETEIDPRFRETIVACAGFSEEKSDAFMHEFIKKLGEAGYLKTSVPEQLGGFGQRLTTNMIVTEEVARANGGLAIHALEQYVFGTFMGMACPAAYAKWGDGVINGDLVIAAAFNSPEGQVNFAEQVDLAKLEGDEWVLNGEKVFSSGGTFADVILVLGLVNGEAHVFAVEPRNTPGMTVTHNPEMGNSPTYATLSFKNCRIPKGFGGPAGLVKNRKIEMGIGFKTFALGVCALSLGSMGAAFDKTVEYLRHRTSNFQPIASLGSIQYKLALMKSKMEAARSYTIIATQLAEANHKDAFLYISGAKQFTCDTAREICEECIQMHGCVGYNPDTGIERYLRDAIGFGIGVCTSEMHLASIAKYMGLPGADFECL
ncbi:MAG TPA: acyl-CoA dehydrogenase family protein [Syntrophomonadaceae bacterium]|nr:acyl-CoA dehydrogenase family protein [Syntrophomonadaceae bacterium]